jgi:hypothetical protein
MKRILLLLTAVIASLSPLRAQQIEATLGDSSFVSIITCGPGSEFYTTWGHSAIRVCDPELGLDLVYNYGTFDFNTKHFYLKFAQGRLDYCLSRGSYENFLLEYTFENRDVWEQQLNMTRQERNNLFVLLEENYRPEHRYYKYDFFRDNCATRVRDMINNALCHRALFVESYPDQPRTYRDMLYAPTETYLLWWRLGVDLVLGQRCDKVCSNMECMFAPPEMMRQVDTTLVKVKDAFGQWVNTDSTLLVAKSHPVVGTLPHPSPSMNPTRCFWLLFVVVLALTVIEWAHNNNAGDKKRTWRLVWLDEILFWITGIASLILLFLWFGSDHYCTKANWNLLWANPLFIYFAIRLRRSNRWVLLAGMVCLLAALTGFWWIPQTLNTAVFPIALTLLLRLTDKFRSPFHISENNTSI